ncbi:MAG: DUF664 domain-containing protein [Acidobacteriia bacterium]|nr:DUF664 domain-containing protein [Terriglobia bacterium]
MSEPWLRGPIDGVDALVSPLLFSFQQAIEDLHLCIDGLTPEQIWCRPQGLTPLGFHVRHAGGAAERLATYLRGESLTEAQLESMRMESNPGADPGELLAELEEALNRVAAYARTIPAASLRQVRHVGRLRLPTTVQGLLVHIAEHTQRHVGQAVTTARLLRLRGLD